MNGRPRRPPGFQTAQLNIFQILNLDNQNETAIFTINGNTYQTKRGDIGGDTIPANELGRGQFGVVYKRKHLQANVWMAEKVITKKSSDSNNKYVESEMELCRIGRHPCLVLYYGTIDTVLNVKLYFELMRTCFTKLLKEIKEREDRFPVGIIAKVSQCTCSALKYLFQEHSIIHRDIMPSNVLIGNDGSVKVTDFGLAKKFVDSRENTIGIGCLSYIAPERFSAEGDQPPVYDYQADVWSVGMMAYELAELVQPINERVKRDLAGRTDVRCAEDQIPEFEIIMSVTSGPPPRLTDATTDDDLISFTHSCLVKDPNKRFHLLDDPTPPLFLQAPSDADAAEWLNETLA